MNRRSFLQPEPPPPPAPPSTWDTPEARRILEILTQETLRRAIPSFIRACEHREITGEWPDPPPPARRNTTLTPTHPRL